MSIRSAKPRPTRSYELPTPAAGNATVSIVAPHWGSVRLDGGTPIVTPLWGLKLAAGNHSVEYLKDDKSSAVEAFTLAVGESKRIVLR